MRPSAHVPRIAGSILAAVALWGCQETPTEPATDPSLARTVVGRYTAVDLVSPGGSTSSAWAINPAGQVVGVSVTAGGRPHAILWRKAL